MAISFWHGELLFNTPTLNDKDITGEPMAVLPDGRIVAVWSGPFENGDGDGSGFGWGVRARIINVDGSSAGEEFVVNTTTQNEQNGASVAVLSDGRFVVAWTSHENGDGGVITNDTCVRARVFSSDGTPASYNGSTADFVVNTIPGNSQDSPVVGALANGAFVIGFRGQPVEDAFSDWQSYIRLYTAQDGPTGPETVVNESNSVEFIQSLSVLKDGGFVVGWFDNFPSTFFPGNDGNHIVLRVFNEDGSPRTGEFLAATSPTPFPSSSALTDVSVAALADGGFVAVWTFPRPETESGGDGSSTSIRGRIFNADGSAREVNGSSADFLINTTTNSEQTRAHVIGLANGGFFVSYSSKGDPEGNFENNIIGRLFNADGTPDGNDFSIAELGGASGGAYTLPNALVEMSDGRILSLFSHTVNSQPGVNGQFLDTRTQGIAYQGTASGEQFAGTDFDDTLVGLGGDDYLVGGAGTDSLDGGEGNDTLSVGDGAATLIGGDGFDTASYFLASNPLIVNLGVGLIGGTSADDTWSSIEGIIGTSFNDTLIGDADDNWLRGGFGADQLVGEAGADTLYGDLGVDYLAGGTGADILYGGHDGDALHGQEDNDTIFGGDGDDVLVGFFGADTLNGDAGNDTIIGDDGDDLVGADDILYGGAGNDQMFGYRGNDQMFGGAGGDFLSGGLGNDTLDGGDGDDNLQGEEGDDTVSGGTGNDALVGQDGNDTLNGDAGNDTLIGNAGSDTLNGGDGNDQIFGYEDVDTANGGTGDDFIAGGSGNDTLHGDDGGDVLDGEADDDQLFGDAGGDNLFGNDGNDTLFGGADNDGLRGGSGNDILDGGAGNDFLIGDGDGSTPGNDTFVFHVGTGNDNIADMQAGAGVGDVIDIRDFNFADFDAVLAAATEINGGIYIQLAVRDLGGGNFETDAIFLEGIASKNSLAADDFLLT